MPTYDYRCEACGHEFEVFQSIKAPVKRKCPTCGKPKLQRLIGMGGGLIFKGSGFYHTDYRSDAYKKSAEAEKNGGEKKTKDGEAKPASTEAAKSETSTPAAAKSEQPKSTSPESGPSKPKGGKSG